MSTVDIAGSEPGADSDPAMTPASVVTRTPRVFRQLLANTLVTA